MDKTIYEHQFKVGDWVVHKLCEGDPEECKKMYQYHPRKIIRLSKPSVWTPYIYLEDGCSGYEYEYEKVSLEQRQEWLTNFIEHITKAVGL